MGGNITYYRDRTRKVKSTYQGDLSHIIEIGQES